MLFTLGLGHLPITTYSRAVAGLMAVVVLVAATILAAIWLTWRGAAWCLPRGPWSRWYGLIAVVALSWGLSTFAGAVGRSVYRPFRLSSESMAPTLIIGDRMVADMRWRGPVRRGDLILFDHDGAVRVNRVAAVAGDRIAMRGGVPVVNGVAAERRLIDWMPEPHDGGPIPGQERLPGMTSFYHVLDEGPGPIDDVAETIVPAGHVFVLGDNRDRSADSRVAVAENGVGMVPVAGIVGRPLYIHWSTDHARIGARLDR